MNAPDLALSAVDHSLEVLRVSAGPSQTPDVLTVEDLSGFVIDEFVDLEQRHIRFAIGFGERILALVVGRMRVNWPFNHQADLQDGVTDLARNAHEVGLRHCCGEILKPT